MGSPDASKDKKKRQLRSDTDKLSLHDKDVPEVVRTLKASPRRIRKRQKGKQDVGKESVDGLAMILRSSTIHDGDTSQDSGEDHEVDLTKENHLEDVPGGHHEGTPCSINPPDMTYRETAKSEDSQEDEGYFDVSFLEGDQSEVSTCSEVGTETDTVSTSDASTSVHSIDLLNKEFERKLTLDSGVQTVDTEPKRRKTASKSCQMTDSTVSCLNKRIYNLRSRYNKAAVEGDQMRDRSVGLERRCSSLESERMSLLAQTEALQHQCVKNMHDNDKLGQKMDQADCHISSLKETLCIRDKEIRLLHRQPTTPNVAKQISEYRELEIMRVDNIRLIHDNGSLTASLDSLNAQLTALRRISRNYDCGDSVILMNVRLAEDNTLLAGNLSAVKRELRSVNQDHETALDALRCVRASSKRSASERDEQTGCNDVVDNNRTLVAQNNQLRGTIDSLRREVESLHSELSNTRTAHQAFGAVLKDKSDLQKQLQDLEDSNSELWSEVVELRHQSAQTDRENRRMESQLNKLAGENEELRKDGFSFNEENKTLKKSLDDKIEDNARMAKTIGDLKAQLSASQLSERDLQNTMEFLQVEHSFIESEVAKKDEKICMLEDEVSQLKKSKEELIDKCRGKLREKTKKLNASRIKLGYALLEVRGLNSQGTSSCSSSE